MSKYVVYYNEGQKKYLQMAARWKKWADANTFLSDSARIGMSKFFKQIGTRFGLITEFRSMGII